MKAADIEIEIGPEFFRETLLPTTHKLMMSNVKIKSVSVFNMVLALRLALLFETVNYKEYNFILKQYVKLHEFHHWRDDNHHFVKLTEKADQARIQALRNNLHQINPELTAEVFEYLDNRLGKEFTYQAASHVLQEELPSEFNLRDLDCLKFGFICPDHEFKAKLTLFMY